MNTSNLFAGIIVGSLGAGYFIYGRKQRKIVPMLVGLGLFVMPYLVSSLAILSLASVVLCLVPFVFRGA